MILIGYDHVLGPWVEKRIGYPITEKYTTIGVAINNRIAAVALYRNFREHDVEVLLAADNPRWATKGNIRKFFSYPFDELGCKRLTAYCSRYNKRSRKLIEGLGFKLEGNMRRAYDGKIDLVVYGMLVGECKWIRQQLREAA